eukprot:887030-Alexandrium_andersonii.AAC.1
MCIRDRWVIEGVRCREIAHSNPQSTKSQSAQSLAIGARESNVLFGYVVGATSTCAKGPQVPAARCFASPQGQP